MKFEMIDEMYREIMKQEHEKLIEELVNTACESDLTTFILTCATKPYSEVVSGLYTCIRLLVGVEGKGDEDNKR